MDTPPATAPPTPDAVPPEIADQARAIEQQWLQVTMLEVLKQRGVSLQATLLLQQQELDELRAAVTELRPADPGAG